MDVAGIIAILCLGLVCLGIVSGTDRIIRGERKKKPQTRKACHQSALRLNHVCHAACQRPARFH